MHKIKIEPIMDPRNVKLYGEVYIIEDHSANNIRINCTICATDAEFESWERYLTHLKVIHKVSDTDKDADDNDIDTPMIKDLDDDTDDGTELLLKDINLSFDNRNVLFVSDDEADEEKLLETSSKLKSSDIEFVDIYKMDQKYQEKKDKATTSKRKASPKKSKEVIPKKPKEIIPETPKEVTPMKSKVSSPQKSNQVTPKKIKQRTLKRLEKVDHTELCKQMENRPIGAKECPICGYSVSKTSHLTQHIQRHSDDNKHIECDQCPKKFFTNVELRIHMRAHTKEKPFLCPICGVSYSSSSHLGIHMRTHRNERPYVCTTCSRAFYCKTQLKNHMAGHTNIRNFKCDLCDAAFNRQNGLRQHKKIHANKLEYKCKLCTARFNQLAGLVSHMNNNHSIAKS